MATKAYSLSNPEPYNFFEDKETEDKFKAEMKRRDVWKRTTNYEEGIDDYMEMYRPIYEFTFEEYPNFKGVLVKLKK